MISSKKYIILALVVILIVGGIIGWYARNARLFLPRTVSAPTVQVRADLSSYKFINPLLFSENSQDNTAPFNQLSSKINSFIISEEKSGQATDVSVYFRDLNAARWTGVNENETYRPSSMLKVVVLMSVLKIAQDDQTFLSAKLQYKASNHADQYYKPDDALSTGYYSVQTLLNAMILDSDNDALNALLADQNVQAGFNSLYALFRLPSTSTTTPDYMSPKSYSTVFRTMYNSTIFPWDLSEQILNLLSGTTFSAGLVAGVPKGTVVAHKFGENTGVETNGTVVGRELHDCGIIYYPGRPYLLCVMTKGSDFSKLEGAISGISKIAYDFVDGGNLGK